MSALSRISKLACLSRKSSLSHCLPSVRLISTSKKKDDTTVVGPAVGQAKDETAVPQKKKFFYDYGFGGKTEDEEYNYIHSHFFLYISIVCVGTGFFIYYRPDVNLKDWAQREAFLELRRREALGLPLIDPNYVDPSTVNLPSDEELGDTEIII